MSSDLEYAFKTLWITIGGPELDPWYRFHPTRRYEFDFAHVATKIAIELEGGTYARKGAKKCPMCGETPKGRHSTAAGYAKDCAKYNEAILLGWRVFRLTSDMLRDNPAGHLEPIRDFILGLDIGAQTCYTE